MTVDMDVLIPRRYQEEIFVRAQQGNVIAALDTGSGKTYISTLLIKWVAARDIGLGRIIVFLVPKVALVQQQGDFIAQQTPLRVSQFCGATAMDMSDRAGWKKQLSGSDVFVMTAQIFLNILTHSHWSLENISLMVFDECHHTRKNHAYNGIMREYFQLPSGKRPKVFGMTASPIWNPKDATESLATLERNLDAKVIAVRDHVDELMGHSPKPEEVIHEYPLPPDLYPEYPGQSLWQRLSLGFLPAEIDIPVERIMTRYQVANHSLGPYAADLYLYLDIKQRVEQLVHNAHEGDMSFLALTQFVTKDGDHGSNIENSTLHPRVKQLQNVLKECSHLFEDESNPDMVPVEVPLKWCSPKLRMLADILFAHYTATFQGIVFVEQRHVAACLARILPCIPQLNHLIRCGQLIGHGASHTTSAHLKGMALKTQQDSVNFFRKRQVNLLIATSVAEEGLDFPACDLVIRFDPMQHMVGYLQSRGRARHKTSTFVIMLPQGQSVDKDRYRAFSESEPQLRMVYQMREDAAKVKEEAEEAEDHDDPADLLERERFVVPSTGAVLTYNSSISLLGHLCSLIPRDRFTPVQLPKYSGNNVATVRLPSSLPLPPDLLVYTGPTKRSKKEAKRAVAFRAVKRLHALNVFDDYLLPAKTANGGENEDADGRPIPDVSKIPHTLDVLVRDPWTRGATQWLHVVYLDGHPVAGLITGSQLPPVELVANGTYVCTGKAQQVEFDPQHEWRQRRSIEDYMRMGLWWCVTGRGISLPLTCYLIPITHEFKIDFATIYQAVLQPTGSYNWSGIGEEQYGHLHIMCNREFGRPLLLRKIRHDLTPNSVPPKGSREGDFPTYRDYWIHKYTRKGVVPEIPQDGPCVEAQPCPRNSSCAYSLTNDSLRFKPTTPPQSTVILPVKMCRWAVIPEHVYDAFMVLPELCHRLTDVYRAHAARIELGLPLIVDDLLVQALTLPSANAGFNNQRLETLGDAVLKLCSVVHVFNKFPHRHEGQLDVLRRNSVSNRTLLARAKEQCLERYLTSEAQSTRLWRYTLVNHAEPTFAEPRRYVLRHFARRSLQDCMEATLGAGFATGGIDMALRTGTALGLSFGGPLPWNARYGGLLPETPTSVLFAELQETLGYHFKHGQLLLEAVTHPSFHSPDSSSYQRLEFLGDALIDLVVMRYLYDKFPEATSGQLSWARSRAVCAPALASIAVKRLALHKILLVNNVELSYAISKYAPVLESMSSIDIINTGWKHDPPKAISDVLESIFGALFIDCDHNFEKAAAITEMIMQDFLVELSPNLPRDPVSELMIWAARSGCSQIKFQKSQSVPEVKRYDSVSVIVHGITVVGPITAQNLSLSKGLAAEDARIVLGDPESEYSFSRICDCGSEMAVDVDDTKQADLALDPKEKNALDDETTEGFATLARIMADEVHPSQPDAREGEDADEDDQEDLAVWGEEQEVEDMMQVDEL